MRGKPTPVRVQRAAVEVGAHLAAWRKLQGSTAQELAERANISRDTLRRVETGQPVGSDVLLNVVRCLGQLDRLVDALDPFETDLGRARAGTTLPQRVRRPTEPR
jgi:transcriptional regulator with XRE-family HTH domain